MDQTFADIGWTALRIVVGLNLAGHGSMKLFKWFGGGGWQRQGTGMENRGVKNGKASIFLAACGEFFGGIGLATGTLTPIAAAGFTSSMLGAIFLSHWPRYWETQRGFEYPFVLLMGGIFYGLNGPGQWSVDHIVGLAPGQANALPYPETYLVGAAIAAVIVALTVLTIDKEKEAAWRAQQAANAAAGGAAPGAPPAAARPAGAATPQAGH